jgi:hypothetical protein
MLIRPDWAGLDSRLGALLRAESFALEHLVTIHSVSSDLRWALVELAVRSTIALLAAAGKRLAFWGRRLAQKVRLANQLSPADTMVAAGGR